MKAGSSPSSSGQGSQLCSKAAPDNFIRGGLNRIAIHPLGAGELDGTWCRTGVAGFSIGVLS